MGLLGDGLKAGASIIGGALGGSATKKAAKIAADAQKEVARMNNDLVREMYGRNEANIDPFMQRGNIASAYMNALLGLPGSSYTTETPGRSQQQGFGGFNGGFGGMAGGFGGDFSFLGNGGNNSLMGGGTTTQVTPVNARRAFNAYKGSTGYKFRFNQGMDALNNGLAQGGTLRSGMAMKDAMRFGQDYASNEFGKYLGYLGNQQDMGLRGAGALAGVGMDAAGMMSANNQSAADAISGSALIRGQANAGMWSDIGKTVGGLFGSSFSGGGGGLDQTIKPVDGINPGQYL